VIRPVDAWELVCDWPECESTADDGYNTIYADNPYDPGEIAEYADWLTSKDGASHYCWEHPTTRASDHTGGLALPDPPYLLIHEGDTDNPVMDDGSVTLVEDSDGA